MFEIGENLKKSLDFKKNIKNVLASDQITFFSLSILCICFLSLSWCVFYILQGSLSVWWIMASYKTFVTYTQSSACKRLVQGTQKNHLQPILDVTATPPPLQSCDGILGTWQTARIYNQLQRSYGHGITFCKVLAIFQPKTPIGKPGFRLKNQAIHLR